MKRILFTLLLLPALLNAQTITTVAGNGTPAYTGDGGAATLASLNGPNGIAIDNAGNLYISEYWNHFFFII